MLSLITNRPYTRFYFLLFFFLYHKFVIIFKFGLSNFMVDIESNMYFALTLALVHKFYMHIQNKQTNHFSISVDFIICNAWHFRNFMLNIYSFIITFKVFITFSLD